MELRERLIEVLFWASREWNESGGTGDSRAKRQADALLSSGLVEQIKVSAPTTTPITLGDIARDIEALRARGATRESIEYAVGRVFWREYEADRIENNERSPR